MSKDFEIYTGFLEYKGIEFAFMFDRKELRLIPPKDRKHEIEYEWFMHKIGEGTYAACIDDYPEMEDPYLIGRCNEDGSKIIFITSQGDFIGRYNTVLCIEVVAYILRRYGDTPIDRIRFSSPEINCIHSIGQSFSFKYDEDFARKGIVQLKTNDFDSVTTDAEHFVYNSKCIEVIWGAARTISHGATETPLKLSSSLSFNFEPTDDYVFVYHLWRIAKQFVQYLCYRDNVFFTKVELSSPYEEGKHITVGELFVLCDLGTHDAELDILKKGHYIKQKYIEGSVGTILQSIADNTVYLRHLPKSHEDGRHIDAARFVMITAAFEWEFRRMFPDGIKKKEKKIKAEEVVMQLLDPLIDSSSGEVKGILKFLKKSVGNDPLSSKLSFIGNELGKIIDVFGNQLYKINGEELKYSEMGNRLANQRNNFAHGNLDKDFDELSLLDLTFLELILYAMQFKFYGIEDVKIKKAINALFQKHIIIEE